MNRRRRLSDSGKEIRKLAKDLVKKMVLAVDWSSPLAYEC